MSTKLGQTVLFNDLTPVRTVKLTNLSGTYYNGTSNNGVGATLTIAASSLTIDSVVMAVGDRCLLQNQTNTYENGIYIVDSIGSTVVLKRAFDQQNIGQLKSGQFVLVGAGTVNAGAAFALVEPLPQVIGTDAFVYVSSPISAALGTAGAKAASDNSKANVASVSGSTVANNFVFAADTAGTIEDSGYNVDNVLQYASVAITAAEFNGMYAAPKLLVAAPGANKLIVVDSIELLLTYGAAAFAAGGVAAGQYDSTVHGAGVLATTTWSAASFQVTASTGFLFGRSTAVAQTFSTCVNKGLYLSNLTGAFTTGDSTFVAKVWYHIATTE